jgi:hypothetical protein
MKTLGLFLLFSLLFLGCGYKPTAHFAKGVLGSKVSVAVDVYAVDPENSVIIKDAILQALVTRFRVVTTGRKYSVTHLDVKLNSIGESSIEYDSNGYVIAKRITTTLGITRHTKGVKKSYNVTGLFDFSIEPNATVSDSDRFKAIKEASLKAIDALIVKLAVEGSM